MYYQLTIKGQSPLWQQCKSVFFESKGSVVVTAPSLNNERVNISKNVPKQFGFFFVFVFKQFPLFFPFLFLIVFFIVCFSSGFPYVGFLLVLLISFLYECFSVYENILAFALYVTWLVYGRKGKLRSNNKFVIIQTNINLVTMRK